MKNTQTQFTGTGTAQETLKGLFATSLMLHNIWLVNGCDNKISKGIMPWQTRARLLFCLYTTASIRGISCRNKVVLINKPPSIGRQCSEKQQKSLESLLSEGPKNDAAAQASMFSHGCKTSRPCSPPTPPLALSNAQLNGLGHNCLAAEESHTGSSCWL